MSIRDELFNSNKGKQGDNAYLSTIYEGWTNDELAEIKTDDRTIFYDSNIAFTEGNATVSSGNSRTVPNLYKTLVGLNRRINAKANQNTGTVSGIPGLNGNYNDTINEFVLTAYNPNDNSTDSVPLAIGQDDNRIVVDSNDMYFKYNDTTFSMADIFKMIEELNARTYVISTNIRRREIVNGLISGTTEKFDLDTLTTGTLIMQT